MTPPAALASIPLPELARTLNVGDVVFIRAKALPFRKVAAATQSWTNHVGIVIDTNGTEPLIAESTFPRSRSTPLSSFVARSAGGRVEVSRLNTPLSPVERRTIAIAARRRFGIFYDTGFNLHSRREFCSRYVREVLDEATGIKVGEVETFAHLLAQNPDEKLTFWRLWYMGRIPWQRETVTPASVLNSSELHSVFNGTVTNARPARRLSMADANWGRRRA